MKLDQADTEVLNAVHQTLRQLMLSLAAASNADIAKLSQALHEGAQVPGISPLAQQMLADLSAGAAAISRPPHTKQ